MARVAEVFESLIIANANNPVGSMGVYVFLDRFAEGVVRRAKAIAPIGDELDRLHDGGVPGTYYRGFGFSRFGSNQSKVRRQIWNTAPHAVYVEKGRTQSFKYEKFATKHLPYKRVIKKYGTPTRSGDRVMERAIRAEATRRGLPFNGDSRLLGT
jgi:hypothetical protein